MEFIFAVLAEGQKVKHSFFWGVHLLFSVIGALTFILYFMLYFDVANYQKMKLMLELIATFFPLLISVVVGINVRLEEKKSCFQTILIAPSRVCIFGAKLVILFVASLLSLACMSVIFLFGISILKLKGDLDIILFFHALIGIAIANFIIYIWHLCINLKFGIGISLFFALFETMQCILYSNIELHGLWRYIPFSWSIHWIQDILNGNLLNTKKMWEIIVVLILCFFVLMARWFAYWEGRKKYE